VGLLDEIYARHTDDIFHDFVLRSLHVSLGDRTIVLRIEVRDEYLDVDAVESEVYRPATLTFHGITSVALGQVNFPPGIDEHWGDIVERNGLVDVYLSTTNSTMSIAAGTAVFRLEPSSSADEQERPSDAGPSLQHNSTSAKAKQP
jgi:hypothetical protein